MKQISNKEYEKYQSRVVLLPYLKAFPYRTQIDLFEI